MKKKINKYIKLANYTREVSPRCLRTVGGLRLEEEDEPFFLFPFPITVEAGKMGCVVSTRKISPFDKPQAILSSELQLKKKMYKFQSKANPIGKVPLCKYI